MTLVRFMIVGAAAAAIGVGCGGNVAPAPKAEEAAFKGTTSDDRTKVEEILKKEGINGPVVSIFKGEKAYQVMVGQPVTPGKRANPSPPTSYTIDLTTSKVTKGSM